MKKPYNNYNRINRKRLQLNLYFNEYIHLVQDLGKFKTIT